MVQTRAFTGPVAELRDALNAGLPEKKAVTDLGPSINKDAGLTVPLKSPPKLLKVYPLAGSPATVAVEPAT
jgi:hypothetical protein